MQLWKNWKGANPQMLDLVGCCHGVEVNVAPDAFHLLIPNWLA